MKVGYRKAIIVLTTALCIVGSVVMAVNLHLSDVSPWMGLIIGAGSLTWWMKWVGD